MLNSLKQMAERFKKRWSSEAIILMYHRINNVNFDPWGLCVSPGHFEEHLEVLQKYANPISLSELVRFHRSGAIPHRSVVITFDDGYADNYYHAKPLLERKGIPATVFVTTGTLGSPREFWWDELEQVFFRLGKLPEKLHLLIAGQSYEWELGRASDYSHEDYQQDCTCDVWDGQPGSRMALYYSLCQKLQPLPPIVRQATQDEILRWANNEPTVRPECCPLTVQELQYLNQGDCLEIGAHTVNHPLLSAHSTVFQQEEIQQSKAKLETLLDQPVKSFAYPFGDYAANTPSLVQDAGFDCACSVVETKVLRKSDRFQFPRFGMKNLNREEFTHWLFRNIYA